MQHIASTSYSSVFGIEKINQIFCLYRGNMINQITSVKWFVSFEKKNSTMKLLFFILFNGKSGNGDNLKLNT